MNKIYTKIPGLGTGRGRFQVGMRQRLYQGPDHLLVVQSTGYTEDYRRVFYRDIRCVIVQKTQRHIWFNVVMIALILILCLLHSIPLPWVVIGIFSIPFVVLLIISLVRGPSCSCYLTTNVQTVAVPTPGHLNKVPLFLDFLETKVPAAQGETVAS